MDSYNELLKQVSWKKDPVEQQLSKSTVKQVEKNRKILLSITDAIKTVGKIWVPLRCYRNDSRYQPDVGEPANHRGGRGGGGGEVGNLNLSVFQFNRETKVWCIIRKVVAAGRHLYKTQQKTSF